MKHLILIAVLFAGGCHSAINEPVDEKRSVDRLNWLTGRWHGTISGAVLEETWLPPKAGTIAAVVRLTKNGKTEFVEIIKIEKVGDALELRLRIFDADLKTQLAEPRVYRAVSQGKQSIHFQGITQSAHRTLSYELAAPGKFVIRWKTRTGEQTEINLSRPN